MKKLSNKKNLSKFLSKPKRKGVTLVNSKIEKELNIKLAEKAKNFLSNHKEPSWNKNNSFLFSNRQTISRLLYINKLYEKIIDVPGVICEFGVHYGGNLPLLTNLRGIHEPYNYTRKIFGFDTFTGFKNDFTNAEIKIGWRQGDYGLPKNYEFFLDQVLKIHEFNAPIAHKKKYELIKGDVKKTFPKFLKKNSQLLISLAFFDLDLYKPTKFLLNKIIKLMPKGGIIAFDDINNSDFPGETEAFKEVIGLNKFKIHKDKNNPQQTWVQIK